MKSKFRVWLIALLGMFVFGVAEVYASGSAYSRARAYLRSDAPSGSGKVYVGQAATSSPSYNTSSSSEKQGEKTTTTYHFYAQAATGYKFTGWYSKNANDEYVAASNSTVSGTTYTYTDAHYVVNVTSGSNPSSGTSYTDKDLYAGFIKVVQMSFIRPEDGSFTITHNGAAVADYASFTVDGKVVLTATPDAGYKLRGWYTTTDGGVTKNYFAFAEEIEPSLTSNVTIGAEFVLDDGKADFWVKGTTTTYNDLNAANTAAAATSAKTIVLVNSGTLPAGTYTISSGVTLLIPYGSDYSKTDQPNIVHVTGIGSAPALSVYKKLSLAAGATINCSGKICVGGQMMSINGGNPTSVVRGRAGVLDLSRGGLINLNSGSVLYAWGFVQGQDIDQGNNTSGMGTIDAKSGSTVWEVFQCGEWRGGTASSTIYSNRSSWKFFPFQSYTVQNIEAPITYRAGATGKCKWTIFGDGKIYTVDFTLIGSSNALFNMGSGATLNKRYDATTDRICYELNGTNAVNALSLSAMGETINSSEYRLPIPANMQITVTGGTTSISNQMVLHAGAYVDIRSGATLNINTNVYIFDQTDWDTYCMYKYYYRSYKSLTKHFDRGEGTSKATLEDATVIVDGNLTFGGSGRLYATTNGANIRGNNGGRITFGTLPTQATIVMCKELKDNVSVSVSSANMHNIDNSYTKAIASTTFHNVNGRWFAAADKDPKADHTYKFTYIKSGAVYGTGGTNATVSTIYRSGWIDVKADVCDNWWDGLNDTYLYNYTFNNAWHQYEQTPTVIGEGDEAATIYSGTDGKLYAKSECTWEEYSGADENCLQTIGGVKKAFVNGAFVALIKNTEDEAYHNSSNATEYYICFKDICEWHAATKVAGANKAYTVTATSQKYIWYNGAWMAATQESPYFYTRSESGEKTYYEYVGSEWTEANVVAESTRNGAMTRYFNLPDAFTDANDNTKPGESTTIKIMKNVTITSALTYRPVDAKGGTCTIDLNGFTLSGSIDNMITINHDKAVLVVLDQSPEETGKISISYSANNTRRRAVYVQNGRLMLNSGTIQATNSQAYVDAIYVNANELCDINGGQVKATATSGAYGIHTAGGTARCTIKGGTVTATSPASKGVYSEGGEIRMSAGTVNATTTGTEAMGLATTNTATSLITLTGGTINATAASTAVGVQVGASGGTNGTATISGGTVSAKTTGATARALRSYATTTVNGGTFIATAATSDARGITVGSGVMRINAGVLVNDTANTQAYAVYTAGGKTWVNGGQFRSATKNTTSAYGFYANAGTDTINGGDFFVTSKTTDAYGIFVPSTTPTVRLNGGKFMVKTSNGSAAGAINNTAASTNLVLAAGYFNVAPAGSYVLAGKEVKDLDATVEASLISAGYTKKIAGTEYTVTFRTYNATASKWVVTTIKVESGKVPVYPDGTPIDYASVTSTGTFSHWRDITDPDNKVDYKDGLPAVGAADVTYQARYTTLYAQVTWGGNDSIFTNPKKAWNFAITKQQATIKILSNYGTEAAGGTMTQLLFNPTNANSIITFDLNGHSWVMGSHETVSENKDVFLNVSPSKANCKLIVTDNSASGNGYLMNKQAYSANLLCANVTAGELLLQGGGLKVNNTHATCNAVGVQANGGVFNMVGGLVESKKEADAVTGGMASGVYAYSATNISGGTIRATNAKSSAAGVYVFKNTFTTTLSDDVHVITNGSQSYAVYGYGTVEVSGGTYDVTAEKVSPATWSTARGVYMCQNSSTYFGKATIKGNPVFNVTGVSGAAYGVYSYNHADVESVVEGGTFNVTTTGAGSSIGVTAHDQATTTVKGGTFNVSIPNDAYEQCFGAYAQTNGIVNVEGGTFTVSPTHVAGNNDCARISGGDDTQLNISGGTFTSTNCAYGVRCFNGTTRITGNPVFTARNGIDVATWANLSGNHTATVIVDGGTFIATTGSAIRSNKHERVVSEVAYNVYGDMTVWDGKFYSGSNQPIDASSGTSYLKIRGGYYSTYTSSNVSNLNKYVVSPSTTEAYATTIDGKAYTYRVNTKYNVTWSVNGNTTVQEYNRNETPNYGSTPTISDGNTYEFLGWNTAVDGSGDTIASVTTDVTYYAVFRKWEAEVIEGEAETGTKFEHFADAWNLAKNMPVAKIKMLSNVTTTAQIILNPDSVSGSRPLTLDLNNHTLEYTGSATSFISVNKNGVKLVIDDQSVSKTGQIKHVKTSSSSVYNVMIEKGELELTGGATIYTKNNKDDDSWHPAIGVYTAGTTNAVFTMTGGTIDTYSKKNAYAIYNYGVSDLRGGQVKATDDSRGEAGGIRALKNTVNISDNVVFTINSEHRAFAVNAEGQAIASSATQYKATVTIDGGTFNVYGKTTAEGLYVNASVSTTDSITFYSYGGDATVNGGTFNVRGENGQIFGVHNYRVAIVGKGTPHSILKEAKGTALIKGGTFNVESAKDGSGNYTGTGNIEGVRNYGNTTISGGTINVKSKQNTMGLRAWFGKLVVEGNPIINVTGENVTRGIIVADYAVASWCGLNNKAEVLVSGGTFNVKSTANTNAIGIYACGCTVESTYAVSADVIVNGGEFIVNSTSGGTATYTNAVAVAGTQTRDNRLTINGGKFKMLKSDLTSAGYNTGGTTSTSQVVLNGGYYNREHSLTTFKAPETQKTDITSAAIDPEYNNGYRYKLSTEYDITWNGGSSYTKTTKVMSGQIPTNTELVDKCFIRNDSAFYFTGWSPTPTYVTGETTYEAVGDYYEAEVKIGSGAWTRYTDFLEAWDVVQANANCSIRLLSNFTLADKILYKPTVANARTVFDLNNFTMTIGGTSTSGIDFNKADAVLTITDGSSAKGGKISMTRNTTSSTYTIYIYNGELKMAGGKIYVQNNQDKVNSSSWWPAIAVYVSTGANAKLTMTGGTVESQAAYLAYTLYNYGTTNISGGTVRANATATGNSLGIYAVNGTATISGGTFNITASSTAVAATATGFINNTGSVCNNGTLNITGGTFNVSATNQSAWALSTNGTGKTISGTVYKAHGVINVSGGTFNVSCPAATATQVFAVQCNGWRLFDEATPHAMLAEELSEVNISSGTFTVDTRNSGAWLDNGGNVDLLRCWGSLNVSGGTFTIYQYKTPNAIQVYRGKATVSGNPVFNVYSHTSNARGITAAGWTHNDYCDKDATKNLAEAEINGGTFKIITEGQNTEGFLASGTTSDGGYAMNGKITVNGGTFLTICPNLDKHYPIMLSSAADRAGTYGTATSEIYVNGGRFKSRKGTEADNTSTGAVNAHNATGKIWLAGGYYETNVQLSARVADTCLVTTLTSADMDPEYANGYRYRIDVDYQAKVTVGAVERKFALFRDAFDYAKTQNNATITLLRNINYEGLNFMYNPSSVRSCTLDLNGFTFKGAVSGHGDYNDDRLLIINKAGATFTIKDSSVGKTGKWSHEKAGATFPVIVYRGQFILQSGTVHGKNTSGGSVQAIRSENYPEALVSIIGGKAHAETAGAAYGMSTYNKATISGGEIIAESSAGEAFGVYTNAAEDTTVISGGRIYAAGTNGYGVRSASITTISGGKILSESINTTGVAYGVSVAASTTTITGVDSIYAHATKNAYGVYSAGTGVATINGGKIISRNGDSNGASITTYAINGGTINTNNGTFYAQRDGAGTSNIQTTRTGNNATMNITGGTFHAEGYQAVNARGGTTNISGGTFYGATGICAMDWADAATIAANVTVTGGTFDCTGVCLNVRSNNSNNSGRNGHSDVIIRGGKFKTTGSTIAQLVQVDGTDPSTLTIIGGYFNEKSSTTHRDQIAGFVADTCKITDITSADIDPEYSNGYRYRVDVDYRVKVTHGVVEKKFVTLNQAFEYAKTVANPTITLIGNANFTGPYSFNPTVANWRGTLDLNNFTITSLQSASFADRYFTLNRSDIKLTVTDKSVAKGGVWNMVGAGVGYNYTIGIVVGLGELELAGGKIYVENNNAAQSVTGINTWCSTINKAFYTQTGGTLEAKSAKSATALTIYGATTISGGEVKATTTSGATARAFTLGAHDGIIGALTISGNPTITVNTATSDAHGIYSNINGATATVSGGTFNITSGTTNAFGVYLQTNPSTITISGGTFNITTSGSGCRGLYLESGNGTINVSGGTFNVTTATSGSESWYNIEGMRITYGTGTINCTGGTFNITNHSKTTSAVGARTFAGTVNLSGTVEMNATQCFRISDTYISEVTAYVNISGGTFNSVSSVIYAKNTEGTDGNAGKFTSSDFTVTGGQFKTTGANHIDGVTPTSALHLQGGYFNERSGTNSRNNLATYVSAPYEVMNLDTDDAEYIAGYRYTVANAPVAKVKVGSSVTYHPTVASAFTAANAATSASTITMLKDATATSYLHYTGSQNCTLDLNGHTISYDGTTTEHRLLRINHADITFTVTDNSVGKEGKLLFNTSKAAASYGVVVIAGNFQLDAGTIEMHASGGTAEGVTPYNSGTSVTINGGKVYVVTTNSQPGYGAYSKKGTTTINGGTIQVEAAGAGYGIYYSAGITTVTDGKFNISGSTAYATNLSSANANMIIQGGWYTTNNRLATGVAAPYQVLNLAGQSPYLYEVAEAYTLTWTTDGDALTGTYTSGLTKPGTTITAPNTPTKTGYTFAAWTPAVAATMPAANTTYTAQWAVASVTTNDVTTPYATMTDAWIAVNSATAASTLTMLQDISISGPLQYTNTQNCTLDLNGHTITSTTNVKRPLHIFASCTFTITDGSAGKSGKLSMTTTYSSDIIFGACAEKGNLVLEAGTIEVISGSQNTCGVTVFTPNSFTMNGGTIHVVTSNSKEGRGLYFNGSVTINDGTIHVEAAGDGYAMKPESGGAITINGGKFNINGATANINHIDSKSGGITIHGGWYNTNNRLNDFVTTPYHVFDLTGESPYRYEVAEGYTLTWATDGGSITTPGTPAGIVKSGATLTAPTVTKTGYTFAAWTPAVATMPAANTTYTATWTPNTNTAYTVKHYKQNLAGDGYDLADTDNLTGTTGAIVTPAVKSYTGFTAPSTQTVTILADGSLVVTYNYTRNSYTLTWALDGGAIVTPGTAAGFVKYGASLTAPTVTKAGYVFNAWSPSVPATMPAANTTYTATWTEAVASVHVGAGAKSYFTTLAAALDDAKTKDNAEITILKDIDGIASAITYDPESKYTCTLNLNNHTIAGTVTKLLTVNTTGKLIIDDSSAEKNGTISMITSANERVYALLITKGEVELKAGKIYSKNNLVYSSSYKNTAASAIGLASGSKFTMDEGIVESECSRNSYAIYTSKSTSTKITINGGLVKGHTNSSKTAGGIYNYTTGLTVNGGTIIGHAWTNTSYGIYLYGGSATINGGRIEATNDTINSNGTTTAIGINVAYVSNTYKGVLTIPETSTVEVCAKAQTNTAYAVNVGASSTGSVIAGGTFSAIDKTSYTARGISSEGDITISGGTFNVHTASSSSTVTRNPCGIYSARGTVTVNGNPTFNVTSSRAYGAFAYGTIGAKGIESTKFSGTIEINGGTFNVTSTATTAYGAYAELASLKLTQKTEVAGDTIFGQHYMPGIIRITGGTFNVTATTNTAYGVVVGAAKTESGFEGAATRIPSGTITGGKFKVVSTGDATKAYAVNTSASNTALDIRGGWYNISTNLDKYTAPTKDCKYYVQPLADATYKWQVSEVANTGFYADIVDVDNTNSKLILNVTSWAVNGWPYTINGTAYEKTAREADRTLKIPYIGEPGDNFAIKVQKSDETTISHRTYIVPKEVTSNANLAQNRDRNTYVNDGATLTVTANVTTRNIYVAPDAKLVINSTKTLTADTIFLRTTAAEAAQLENNGTIAGTTKVVYTRIIKDKDFHLFGLPLPCPISSVCLSDGLSPAYGTGWLLRSYDEARRAEIGADDNNWVSLAAGSTIAGGAGYEMFSASNYYREFYFPVDLDDLTNQVPVTYHLDAAGAQNAGWNALVSPFTHTYTNDPAPENLVVNWYMDGYGYYEQEIPSVIPPAKPFAFQATKNGYLSFEGTSIVAKMPRRAAEEEVQIQWINLDITDADGIGDQTSVYSHPTRYEAAYQTGIDVAKQSLTAARAIIYSSHAYGEMAFAGVADSLLEQGVALTVYSPKPQELTVSMRDNRWLDRLAEVWLIDVETGTQTDLLDSDYTFEAKEGTTAGRLFLMGRFKAPRIPTDIENAQSDKEQGTKVRKYIYQDKMYIVIDGRVYDATGRTVMNK